MTVPKSPSMPKIKCIRLSSQFLSYLVCFFVGCTFSVSFMSTMECSKSSNKELSPTQMVIDLKETADNVPLVVLILSAPDNTIKRHALRRTWLSLAPQELVKYFFVIGSKTIEGEKKEMLLAEEKHYSDLLTLPNAEDSYDLLTSKLLESFIWTDKHLKFDFILKVDDDSFVDIRSLLRELTEKENYKKLYWGYFNGRAQIKQRGKWKDTNWNMCDRYVPYARGGGYILSRQLVHFMAENAMLLNTYKNEDVSIGMWLAPLNVTRIHDIRFDTEWASRGCSNTYLVTHPHDVAEIYRLHEALTNNGRMCKLEFQKRPAYHYDWSVLPSECCNSLAL